MYETVKFIPCCLQHSLEIVSTKLRFVFFNSELLSWWHAYTKLKARGKTILIQFPYTRTHFSPPPGLDCYCQAIFKQMSSAQAVSQNRLLRCNFISSITKSGKRICSPSTFVLWRCAFSWAGRKRRNRTLYLLAGLIQKSVERLPLI